MGYPKPLIRRSNATSFSLLYLGVAAQTPAATTAKNMFVLNRIKSEKMVYH
jgi:hypothetical protein